MNWKSTGEQMCTRLTGAGHRALKSTFPDMHRPSADDASQMVTGAVLQELYRLLLDEPARSTAGLDEADREPATREAML